MDILVIEDEKKLATQLCESIHRYDSKLNVVNVLPSVKQSVEWLRENSPDLIFMDVKLSDGSCFDIFEVTNVDSPVVFCTGFNDYAVQAFENNGIAYILKPVTQESIAHAFNKVYNFSKHISASNQKSMVNGMKQAERRRFFVLVGTKLLSIQITEISHFYASDKVVYLVDFKGNKYIINHTLEYLDTILPKQDFFRINRKFIVSFQTILKMSMYGVNRVKIESKVAPVEDMIVSVDRTAKFKLWLDDYLSD